MTFYEDIRGKLGELYNSEDGGFLPTYIVDHFGLGHRNMDGAKCRALLEEVGIEVAGNADKGTHGAAWTIEGLYLSSNGFVHKMELAVA